MRTRDPDKIQRIKDATIRLILREGIENASVSKIAREAGVSPATIYVYYDSKEEMLAEVYREYARQSYLYMMHGIRPEMSGRDLIDSLVRNYFSFSIEHEEIFSFVEQCTHCPTLSETVSLEECSYDVLDLFSRLQERGEMRPFSHTNLGAVIFAPVRYLVMNRKYTPDDSRSELDELVAMLQRMLLM